MPTTPISPTRFRTRKNALLTLALCTLAVVLPAKAQDEGLFVTFSTTLGDIRTVLYPDEAPVAVANFVGLIEGSQKALDAETGKLFEDKYFDGMAFHRVIDGFVIQAGAKNGGGADGPGYTFQDEFHPSRTFNEPFVLAMANSGPNSNGSQFFINVEPTPHLNNVHTVFGKVVEGSDVAVAISKVATDTSGRPNTPVVLESVTVQRVGAEAEGYQPDTTLLPQVGHPKTAIRLDEAGYELTVPLNIRSDYTLFVSRDLQTREDQALFFIGDTAEDRRIDLNNVINSQTSGFFRLVEVRYPGVVFPPEALADKTLDTRIMTFGNLQTNSTLAYDFTGTVFGTSRLGNGTMGEVSGYSYTINGPAKATLVVPSTNLDPAFSLVQFILSFASASTGNFVAFLPKGFPPGVRISGTFTLNDTVIDP